MTQVKGGGKLAQRFREISNRLSSAKAVKIGFLENSTYPDGTSLPMIAAVNEFGGTVKVPEHQVDIYRKISANGDFLRKGRFVKQKQSNFQTTHDVKAHAINIPARPYFRPMIAEHKGEWGPQLADLLKANDYNAKKALGQMGQVIAGQLRDSILSVSSPALAPSTVRKKGNSKLLVDSGHMLNSIQAEVED
jgi:hypothetical protein